MFFTFLFVLVRCFWVASRCIQCMKFARECSWVLNIVTCCCRRCCCITHSMRTFVPRSRDFIPFITIIIIIIDISKYLLLFFFSYFSPACCVHANELDFQSMRVSNKPREPTHWRDLPLLSTSSSSSSLMAHVHYRFPSNSSLSFHREPGSARIVRAFPLFVVSQRY